MGKNKKPKTHDKNPAGHNNRKNSCKDLPQSEDRTKELQSSNAEGHDPVQKKSSKQNEKFKQKEVAYKSREVPEEKCLSSEVPAGDSSATNVSSKGLNVENDKVNKEFSCSNTTQRLQDGRFKPAKSCTSQGRDDKFDPKKNSITKQVYRQDSKRDLNFSEFEKIYNSKANVDNKIVVEKFGDLFEAPEDNALAHCVAEDMSMGSGIATTFRSKFKRVDELLNQRVSQGGVAYLNENGRFIYYLVTKRESSGKPTYETLWRSLIKLKNHMVENEQKKLAIPKLGCGLDRLEWSKVKPMLEYIFKDAGIEITCYDFQMNHGKTKQKLLSTKKDKKKKDNVKRK